MNKRIVKEIFDWVLHIALAVVFGLIIIIFLGRFTVVEGNSMAPTLQHRNLIIIESVTKRFGTIQPGDIVVLKIPEMLEGHKKYAIKRVIATENQHVKIADGKVYVDGVPISEPYINGKQTEAESSLYADITVPEGCIYVLGDNRIPGKSRDSRIFGPVNEGRIVGKFWIRLYPFSEAGTVPQ